MIKKLQSKSKLLREQLKLRILSKEISKLHAMNNKLKEVELILYTDSNSEGLTRIIFNLLKT